MSSKLTTPGAFIDSLPEDRKTAVSAIREAIGKNIPSGFEERVGMGGIIWVVPHSIFPAGYRCDPTAPLMLMTLVSTKGHISLHHMGLYGSGPLAEWFKSEWPKYSTKKLDMGKACIRFKKPEDIPVKLIGKLASKLTPKKWVDIYEKAIIPKK